LGYQKLAKIAGMMRLADDFLLKDPESRYPCQILAATRFPVIRIMVSLNKRLRNKE
jgi:hypothetical protein